MMAIIDAVLSWEHFLLAWGIVGLALIGGFVVLDMLAQWIIRMVKNAIL